VERRVAPVRGRRAAWHVAGSGRPLVCVHGLGGSWRWWLPTLPALAGRHEVHLVDLPRFGRGPGRVPPDAAADWLADWLGAAGFERAALAGHSLGGLLSAQLAARRPERVERLVLVDPAGIPTGWSPAREALSLLSALWTVRPRFLPTLVADGMRAGPRTIVLGGLHGYGTDVRGELGRIEAPTLVVWGERDTLLPTRLAPAWRDAIPGAELAIVPRAGHVPMFEEPEAFAAALGRFL
jgi:pimeloyl-ACP methyl ester carboxylesterase